MREFLYPGFTDTSADTFTLKDDPRSEIVGHPFARYRYDPARATQDLADAGWAVAADGRLIGRDGPQVQIEVRGGNTDVTSVSFVADAWRRLGVNASEVIVAGTNSNNPEYRSTFPGVENTARGVAEQILPNFDGRLHSTAENRWTGSNRMHYANRELDQRVDRLYGALDPHQQGQIIKEIGDVLSADLPALPLYFVVEFAASARGVRAMTDDFVGTIGPGNGPGLVARNAYLWDRT
ncbi:MAG: peptide transporter [Chloroflexi bacterium]|nr:peptide transporter [Chloroflexota bacterium]